MPDLQHGLPLPPDERIGIALVGLGAYTLGQILPNIGNTKRVRLAALVSGNAEKAQAVARAYGLADEHVYSYETFGQIADDETVDVVYVVLPNAFHRAWTERAFAAGKHVLCEKPMAETAEDYEAMIRAGREAGRKLMIAYRAQYDPYNLEAIRIVREGEIGTPRLVVADHGRPLNLSELRDQWRAVQEVAEGGSLVDIGVYSVNGARYLLGEEPVAVTAQYHPPSGDERVSVEEGISWQMEFPSGAVALCSSSYQVDEVKRIHVQGAEGSLTLNPATDYYERNLDLSTEKGKETRQFPQANQFAAMLDEMAEAVHEDREPKTPGEEGLRDVRILQAIYRAADTGERVALEA